ncbi:uncharacterized protein LOC143021982 [Oratosquilla oratoria]|uniref:uncharacterized protein LOC143021982 n=1 Tax=Oratosquilla oratoria TaxID=337810 RepID=UPI003F760B87
MWHSPQHVGSFCWGPYGLAIPHKIQCGQLRGETDQGKRAQTTETVKTVKVWERVLVFLFDGQPMGLPLSAIAACLAMEILEQSNYKQFLPDGTTWFRKTREMSALDSLVTDNLPLPLTDQSSSCCQARALRILAQMLHMSCPQQLSAILADVLFLLRSDGSGSSPLILGSFGIEELLGESAREKEEEEVKKEEGDGPEEKEGPEEEEDPEEDVQKGQVTEKPKASDERRRPRPGTPALPDPLPTDPETSRPKQEPLKLRTSEQKWVFDVEAQNSELFTAVGGNQKEWSSSGVSGEIPGQLRRTERPPSRGPPPDPGTSVFRPESASPPIRPLHLGQLERPQTTLAGPMVTRKVSENVRMGRSFRLGTPPQTSEDRNQSLSLEVSPDPPGLRPPGAGGRSARDTQYTQASLPRLRYTPLDQTVALGGSAVFKCTGVGNPPPHITWAHDGPPLISSNSTSAGIDYVDADSQLYKCIKGLHLIDLLVSCDRKEESELCNTTELPEFGIGLINKVICIHTGLSRLDAGSVKCTKTYSRYGKRLME